MTDTEQAVMNELWSNVNSLRWQTKRRLAAIARYREWLPQCQDRITRNYYKKWLDYLENETKKDQDDTDQKERVRLMRIERP